MNSLVISNILVGLGLLFMVIGMYGLFRFKSFYSRVLITAKIEIVGFLTVLIGLIVREGRSFSSIRLLLVIVLFVITNPLSTHAISRSAYIHEIKGGECDD